MSNIYGDGGPSNWLGPLPAFKDGSPIGFVEFPPEINGSHCLVCEYEKDGVCQHSDPHVKGRPVTKRNCCNLYDIDGMKVIV